MTKTTETEAAANVRNIEKRVFPVSQVGEVRMLDGEGEGASPRLVGHIAVFNQWSGDLGGFIELIKPGAFSRVLASQADIVALWNHDTGLPLGRLSNGHLALAEDERGLAFEVTPPDTTWARDRLVSVQRGDVKGSSFAFIVGKGNDEWDESGDITKRTINEFAEILEVSPGVTFPAFPQAGTALRSLDEWRAEHAPADVGMSVDFARRRLDLAG